MRTSPSTRAAVAAVVLIALAGVGYVLADGKSGGNKAQRRAPPPAPVLVAAAKTQDMPIRLSTIGAAQARATVAVKSRVDGQLMEAHFREGEAVEKGALLFRIDPRPFAAQLRQAEANQARDRATLAKVKGDLVRYQELAAKGFSSRQKYEETVAAANSLEAVIRANEAAIDFARLQLGYTEIRAPISGRAGSLLVNVGNLVKANDTQALVVIHEIKPIYVSFALPEQHLAEVKRRIASGGLTARVSVPDDPRPPAEGTIDFVNNAVDAATGTIGMRATFANADERLTPGQFVTVEVTMSTLKDVVVVVATAIQSGQKGTYLFVVKKDDMTVEQRMVTTGITVERMTVIREGLKAGETVVVDGQLRLFPGAKVAPKEAPAS